MKKMVLFLLGGLVMTSCVSNKKFRAVQEQLKTTEDLLNTATIKLNSCLKDKELLQSKNEMLAKNNEGLMTNLGNMTILTQKGADNLERSLESLKEKDLTIKNLRDAVTRRDSINLALVQSLKGVLGNLDDEDITVQVDKGVVYVSISDKMLFSSGSYNGRGEYVPVTSNASADGRALNRRTRIVVLPKLDQFYNMIEQGMKDPKIN